MASSAGGPDTPIDRRIKVLSIGDGGVGKSCLIKRYCEGKFVTRYISTIGVDFGVKPVTINNVPIKVNFWDLSGHQEFFEIRNEFYKDTQGCMIVYDVTNRASFEAVDKWLLEAKKFDMGDAICVLCANKVDKKRVVSAEEGEKYAKDRGLEYFETSAHSGQNISEMFGFLFTAVVSKLWPYTMKTTAKRRGSRRRVKK